MHRWWLHCVPWEKQASNSIKTLFKMFWKNAFDLFIILSRRIFLLSSKDVIPRQHPKQVRRSKCFRTMWHSLASSISRCKVVMVTWRNFMHMRYCLSHLLSQTLASSIYQAQNLTYWNVLRTYDCIVLDGAVTIHLLPTTEVSTFQEYADKVFIPYLSQQLQHATRVDVVWDTSTWQLEGVNSWKRG